MGDHLHGGRALRCGDGSPLLAGIHQAAPVMPALLPGHEALQGIVDALPAIAIERDRADQVAGDHAMGIERGSHHYLLQFSAGKSACFRALS